LKAGKREQTIQRKTYQTEEEGKKKKEVIVWFGERGILSSNQGPDRTYIIGGRGPARKKNSLEGKIKRRF